MENHFLLLVFPSFSTKLPRFPKTGRLCTPWELPELSVPMSPGTIADVAWEVRTGLPGHPWPAADAHRAHLDEASYRAGSGLQFKGHR